MGLFDSADLLARAKRTANRPSVDESMQDADWYALLTEAQLKVTEELANHVPESQYTTEQLATSDGGITYTFVAEPLGGFIELRAGRTGRELLPGPDFDPSADFVIGKGTVGFPGGVSRSFPGGLWARYVPTPGVLSATAAPVLSPTMARRALPSYACYLWAKQPGTAADPTEFLKQYQEVMWGSGALGDVGVVGTLKQQYFVAGSAGISGVSGSGWWRNISSGDDYVPVRH